MSLLVCWMFIFSMLLVSQTQVIDYLPTNPHDLTAQNLLTNYLIKDDFSHNIKIMQNHMRSSFYITTNKKLKIVIPVIKAKSLSISMAPCFGQLKWHLSWRPPSIEVLEVVQKYRNETSDTKSRTMEHFMEDRFLTEDKEKFHKRRKRRVKPLGLGKRLYKTKTINGNFSAKLLSKPVVRYLFNEDLPLADIEISSGEGNNPWIFSRSEVYPGLYILTISSSEVSKIYAIVSGDIFIEEDFHGKLKAFSRGSNINAYSLTISWRDRQLTHDKSCLAISRKRLYSSLCSATNSRSLFHKSHDHTLMVGCIHGNEYNIPATSKGKYYITIWNANSLIPYTRAMVEPRPKRQLPRLKSGEMVSFTLAAGGYIEATYIIRRKSKKLHVAAVSCTGGVKMILYQGKHRIAGVRGKEIIHLAVRHPLKGKVTIRVYPDSPKVDFYRVKLVAAHSARRLPVPRLPKNVRVKAKIINCTSAVVTWGKAKGGAYYCIGVRHHPSGQPPEIRTPIQCGWELTIKYPNYFLFLKCLEPQPQKRQTFVLTNLEQEMSYLINIFVKHPVTGTILALFPAMISVPVC